jgi:hypothetical protein
MRREEWRGTAMRELIFFNATLQTILIDINECGNSAGITT